MRRISQLLLCCWVTYMQIQNLNVDALIVLSHIDKLRSSNANKLYHNVVRECIVFVFVLKESIHSTYNDFILALTHAMEEQIIRGQAIEETIYAIWF